MIQKEYGLPVKNYKWFIPKHLQKKFNIKKFNWDFINKQYLKIIKDFINKNPNFEIIIKSKVGYIEEQLKPFNKMKNKNIKIIKGGDSYDIIKKCKYVVAFNSTVLFETIAANRILISIKVLVKNKNYFGFILETNKIGFSYKFLNKLNLIKKTNVANRNYYLKKYMGNTNGDSSLKAAISINTHLNNYFQKSKNI